ncbi:hypothetical protein PILCRDRAFT_15611 [Piloderma croceum F 1598]|uniref:Uncharacterized protein n=1 Tax=Piloderma croceum (strain F 1598) TaxID=765440 RepID=A0A0C3AGS2_PILCF|nr:hypothetical protein PILCRDRAFT_15611 [Piloderma croceum F 1598]
MFLIFCDDALVHFNRIHMFDVGGQRSEQKKWIHCFESVTGIIFCTALSEHDQVLLEESKNESDGGVSGLVQERYQFEWFLHTSMIIFLNKINVFKSKLPKVPLEKYFPDKPGAAERIPSFRCWSAPSPSTDDPSSVVCP